jgi:hypothetical protein
MGRSVSASRLYDCGPVRRIGEVGDQDLGPSAAAAHCRGRALEAGAVARDEHEVHAALGETVGEDGSEASACAGDECGRHGEKARGSRLWLR